MRKLLLIIIILFILTLYVIFRLEKYEVTYQRSTIDNLEYLVRDLPDKQMAADILATIKFRMTTLTNHLYMNRGTKFLKHKEYIEQLKTNSQNTIINESDTNGSYTSYSINKGEQIVFCLRSKNGNQLHDINLVMYVVLHEMAHVACPEYGHTDLFKRIFAFLTNEAIKLKLYRKINFVQQNEEYCGLMITESII